MHESFREWECWLNRHVVVVPKVVAIIECYIARTDHVSDSNKCQHMYTFVYSILTRPFQVNSKKISDQIERKENEYQGLDR